MNRFKIGDRVRLNQDYAQFEAGTVGVVKDSQGGIVTVLVDSKDRYGRNIFICLHFRLDYLIKDTRPLEEQIKELLG